MNGPRVARPVSGVGVLRGGGGGLKEERDIKQQAAGLIAFKAARMMYGAAGAPANTLTHPDQPFFSSILIFVFLAAKSWKKKRRGKN